MHRRPSGISEPQRRAPPGEVLVRVSEVHKAFRNAAGETPVLTGTSLELHRGETTSLVGASGSGKSTLLSLLAALMRPDSGEIAFDGTDIAALDDSNRARLRAGRIGIVLQSGNLVPFLTAVENVELAMLFADGGSPGSRARHLLSEVGLGHRTDQVPGRMSGGEAQRVAIAMALANDPDLLLADEVTGELDSATAEQVLKVVFDACRDRGLTVLFVTHSPDVAARAQHRYRMAEGRVLAA
jgi:predicted ABC-type transport system involved in lysophospholipase L1 biosynthesis ATPase subunit